MNKQDHFWWRNRLEVQRVLTMFLQIGKYVRCLANNGVPASIISESSGLSQIQIGEQMEFFDMFAARYGDYPVEASRAMVVLEPALMSEFMQFPEVARLASRMTRLSLVALQESTSI